MTFDVQTLPSDPAALQQIVSELLKTLDEKDLRIRQLSHQLEALRRHAFGRKSEKIDPNQMLFALDEIRKLVQNVEPHTEAPRPEVPSPAPQKKNGHARKRLPEDLPRQRIEYPVPESELVCACCHTRKEKIGEEVTEELDYHPASHFIREHVRPKYACPNCEAQVAIADPPSRPIEKGKPGPGLLAHVLTSKYADHLPLNRLEGIFRRHGLEIRRSTLCDWVGDCAELLSPLVRAIREDLLKSGVIHTDDTPVPVLDADREHTRQGRLWVYIGDPEHENIVFDYTPDRRKDGPRLFLDGYRGYLQADAFGGYDAIYAEMPVVEVACWAHARRYFYESKGSDPVRSHVALGFIHELYEVEREAKEKALGPDAKAALRQERSKPVLAQFRTWLNDQSAAVLPKSPIGEAIRYAFGQWEALNRYTENGHLAIDNNFAERILRCVAVGRKNWMFAGSDEGGRRAAVIYSLVSTCKHHGIDPFEYLRDVLARIATLPVSRLPELFPKNWKRLREKPPPDST